LLGLPAGAETVLVEAGRDATLIQDPEGAWANGSGPYLFAGRTSQAQNGIRRGLLYFDVAAVLPRQAIIESAVLRVFQSGGNSRTQEIGLFRLLDDWGEGPSSSSGGGGAPSQPGDATWLHAFYDGDFWVRPGGSFVRRIGAGQEIGATGFFTWESTRHLIQDVRLWNSAPWRNFGWILIGDETTPQNAKRFASRDNPDPSLRPLLEISYRLPGTDGRP
jgi:hypothetical protein